jgi:hypothetical protein
MFPRFIDEKRKSYHTGFYRDTPFRDEYFHMDKYAGVYTDSDPPLDEVGANTYVKLIKALKEVVPPPIGGPAEILMMLDFCSRHAIEPTIEQFPFSRVYEAMGHLESGEARYRIVLQNDFK